jgi:hypothetical protein
VGQLIPDAASTAEKVGTDFDFAEANAKFEKAKDQDIKVGYNKASGFFDTISCEASRKAENAEGQQGDGMDRAKRREMDKDTFGASALKRPFGRGRGRGRRF